MQFVLLTTIIKLSLSFKWSGTYSLEDKSIRYQLKGKCFIGKYGRKIKRKNGVPSKWSVQFPDNSSKFFTCRFILPVILTFKKENVYQAYPINTCLLKWRYVPLSQHIQYFFIEKSPQYPQLSSYLKCFCHSTENVSFH